VYSIKQLILIVAVLMFSVRFKGNVVDDHSISFRQGPAALSNNTGL
jgi:hypothetical protein